MPSQNAPCSSGHDVTPHEGHSLRKGDLVSVAALFLKLGATGFGGPAAHIALMREEVVVRRQWLTEEEFLDRLGATNLIPGPNSTELALHIGWERAGPRGLLVAGFCFIAPAMVLTWACAWAYVRYESMPSLGWLLYGIKPVMVALVVDAIVSLVPKAASNPKLALLGMASALSTAFGIHELTVLVGAGCLSMLHERLRSGPRDDSHGLSWLPPAVSVGPLPSLASLLPSTPHVFLVFLKIGSVLFGSGYVLLAFLRADLVERLHWLTERQLMDAIAVGQVTPGPLFTTATFVGYLLAGTPGAMAATLGIFLPAFVLVAMSGPLLPRLRRSKNAAHFLDGVNVASLALMAVVAVHLGQASLVDAPSLGLCLVCFHALRRYKPNATWLIVGGALLGILRHGALRGLP